MTAALGVRRILVTLDAGPGGLAALDRAARLAAVMEAELAGLLIQDEGLLRLCELPVWEVSVGSGAARRPDRQTLEWELRAQAAEMRRRMEVLALQRRLAWSFHVARGRGRIAAEGAAAEAELVILGAVRRTGSGAGTRSRIPAPVVAVYEGGATGPRVLQIALRAADGIGGPLLVLLPAADEEQVRARRAEADRLLAQSGIPRAFASVPSDMEAVAAALATAGASLVVLQDGRALREGGGLDRVVEAAGCDVMLVRAEGADAQAPGSGPAT